MTKQEQRYVEYLNEIQPDYESENWIIGGKNRVDEYYNSYGLAIYKYDPIAFQVGLREYLLNN